MKYIAVIGFFLAGSLFGQSQMSGSEALEHLKKSGMSYEQIEKYRSQLEKATGEDPQKVLEASESKAKDSSKSKKDE